MGIVNLTEHLFAMSTISIEVDDDTARAYAAASAEQRLKVQILLKLQLKEIIDPSKQSLQKVMDEIGAAAQARGLTPEILESLLHDD